MESVSRSAIAFPVPLPPRRGGAAAAPIGRLRSRQKPRVTGIRSANPAQREPDRVRREPDSGADPITEGEEEEEVEQELAEKLEGLEEEVMAGTDEGREPTDYDRRAHIFSESSRVFRALKERSAN
ncbi:uncharacterized protein LOC109724339 [Ananas comosus]|uniref:Uncharacterized protein LOC109724339 n=1 Tax=Ananas comosus TaxID=4615 RepID=A0A6P5GJ85_ANACO|nr:uncharacterized protein LOC109724339 [Ananas comosus]